MYAELVKDPLIVAVIAALIGVALSQFGSHLYGLWAHRTKRNSTFKVLRNQLQNHGKQLSEIEGSLGKGLVCTSLDPSPALHFLNGDVVALPKDEKLVTALYDHLRNIEKIRRAIDIIGMRSAGWTSEHADQKEALEQSPKEGISNCQADLDSCLKELPQ